MRSLTALWGFWYRQERCAQIGMATRACRIVKLGESTHIWFVEIAGHVRNQNGRLRSK